MECGICLCDNTESLDSFITLSCNHTFHYTCLNEFYNYTEYYKYKCCYCSHSLQNKDVYYINTFYKKFNDIIIKCKYSKLRLTDLKDININTNNSELLLHCIITNNLSNFIFLLDRDIHINEETIKNIVMFSIKYENAYIIKFIIDNFQISKKHLYLECINNCKYKFLLEIIDICSTNPILAKKDILFKSIIDNNYDLFYCFKQYLKYFNINNINTSIYFSLYNSNLFMFKDISIYCKTNNIQYKNTIDLCIEKLNYNIFYKYMIYLM